ncbi:pyridoxal phosphate-dependent aminotransferase [Thermosulfuriphilus sp.]
MVISQQIVNYLEGSSWIRKMFEEGARLKSQYGPEAVCDFSLGNPDLSPPADFLLALKEVAQEEGPGIHGYMPNAGYPFVREAMARRVSEEQELETPAENVVMTCGAAGAINVVFKAILEPGDEVIFPSPFFVEYRFYVENHQGHPVPVPTKADFHLDLEALDKAITPKTRAVLINSPHNPTGQVYDSEELKGLARILEEASRRHGRPIFLLSDEPYRRLTFDGFSPVALFPLYHQTIVINSFSKELSIPGERLGYLALHPEAEGAQDLMAAFILANRILGFVNAPALIQRAVARCPQAAIDVGIYQRRRDLFCEILEEAGYEFVRPRGAFYVFPRTPIEDDVAFCRLLAEEKILAVPGRGFGAPGYMRLAFCVDEAVIERSREGFKRALERAKALKA